MAGALEISEEKLAPGDLQLAGELWGSVSGGQQTRPWPVQFSCACILFSI